MTRCATRPWPRGATRRGGCSTRSGGRPASGHARSSRAGPAWRSRAPVDALYAATELNEAAWAGGLRRGSTAAPAEARRAVGGAAPARHRGGAATRAGGTARRCPGARRHLPRRRGAGLGRLRRRRLRVAGRRRSPCRRAVPWERVHDVPVALVTGSNGKTTVVRLLAAMLEETGRAVGLTSTDGVSVRGATLVEGRLLRPERRAPAAPAAGGPGRGAGDRARRAPPPGAERGPGGGRRGHQRRGRPPRRVRHPVSSASWPT